MATPNDALQERLIALTTTVERLLVDHRRLREENRSLRISQESLNQERASLLARNEQARTRIEGMIQRLKSLEVNG